MSNQKAADAAPHACRHTGAFGASSGCAKCNAELAAMIDDPRTYRGVEERTRPALTPDQLYAEIARLRDLLTEAEVKASAQFELIDKLTAAHLRVELILKKLNEVPR